MQRFSPARFFFSVDVEEWFTSSKVVAANEQRYQKESDLLETMDWLITQLKNADLRGTFFFIFDLALRFPDLVHRLISEGHEIALHGETHADLRTLSMEQFERSLFKMRSFFSERFGRSLKGYRAPYFSIHPPALALLKKTGFCYDSSVVPCIPIPGWYGQGKAPLLPYFIGDQLDQTSSQSNFLEFPLSVFPRLRLPGLGGLYFRNFGFTYTQRLLNRCIKQLGYAVFYLHPWELSNHIPKVKHMPFYFNRHAGDWTRNALNRLLKEIKSLTILNETFEEFYAKHNNHVSF